MLLVALNIINLIPNILSFQWAAGLTCIIGMCVVIPLRMTCDVYRLSFMMPDKNRVLRKLVADS